MNQQIDHGADARLAFKPLVRRLRLYNEWRRGAEIDQPSAHDVGKDIDAAADMLESMSEAIKKTVSENLHLADGESCTLRHLLKFFDFA